MPNAGYLNNYTTKAANYTVSQIADQYLIATAAMTFTLPAASTCFLGQTFTVQNGIAANGVVTVAPAGSDTINGAASSTTLGSIYGSSAVFVTDGSSAWFKFSQAGGNVIPPQYAYVTANLGAFAASVPVWTAPNTGESWKIVAASARFTTASTSGTLALEVAAAATAVGSGTAQDSSTVSLAGTANTTVNITLTTQTTIVAGASINAVKGGDATSLAGTILTIALQRVS